MDARNILIPPSMVSKLERLYKAANASEFAITGKETPLTDGFILEQLSSKVDSILKQKTEANHKKQMVRVGELQAKGYTFQKACEAVGLVVPKDAVQPVNITK